MCIRDSPTLWPAQTSSHNIIMWCDVMWYDVMSFCDVAMSCFVIWMVWWCRVMMSCDAAMWWCRAMMSCDDVMRRFDAMIVWCDYVTIGCYVMMWSCDVLTCCTVVHWCAVMDVVMWYDDALWWCDVLMCYSSKAMMGRQRPRAEIIFYDLFSFLKYQ